MIFAFRSFHFYILFQWLVFSHIMLCSFVYPSDIIIPSLTEIGAIKLTFFVWIKYLANILSNWVPYIYMYVLLPHLLLEKLRTIK